MLTSTQIKLGQVFPNWGWMVNQECEDESVEVVFIGTATAPQLEQLTNANVRSSTLLIVESHDYGQYEQDNCIDDFN